MNEGTLLLGSLGLGLVGGIVGAVFVFLLTSYCKPLRKSRVSPGLHAEMQELNTGLVSMGERTRRSSFNTVDREVRQQLAALNAKIDAKVAGNNQAEDEGDWSNWTTARDNVSLIHALDPSAALSSGWAKDFLAPDLGVNFDKWGKPHPVSMIVFTDFGGTAEDAGDEVALFVLRGLETLEFVHAKAVIIAGEGPANRPARAQHIIDALGFAHGLVLGVGSSEPGLIASPSPGGPRSGKSDQSSRDRTPGTERKGGGGDDGTDPNTTPPSKFPVPVWDSAATLPSASQAFFSKTVDDPTVPDYSVVVNVLCAATDLAEILRQRGEAVARKLKCVCLLGAVFEKSNDYSSFAATNQSNSERYLRPDPSHPQHAADPQAADYVYWRLQELGVPLVVVGRHAVYSAAVPAALYDELAQTNSPFAKALKSAQRKAIEDLWQRVQAPDKDPAREGLPGRCTSKWFAQVFCGGVTPPLAASPWDFIKSFNMYDCVALVASQPDLRFRMFSDDPENEYDAGTAVHTLYGQSEPLQGVRRPRELKQLITSAALAGLSSSPEPYPILIFTDPGQDLDDELAMVVLRSLAERRYVRPIGLVASLQPSDARALIRDVKSVDTECACLLVRMAAVRIIQMPSLRWR